MRYSKAASQSFTRFGCGFSKTQTDGDPHSFYPVWAPELGSPLPLPSAIESLSLFSSSSLFLSSHRHKTTIVAPPPHNKTTLLDLHLNPGRLVTRTHTTARPRLVIKIIISGTLAIHRHRSPYYDHAHIYPSEPLIIPRTKAHSPLNSKFPTDRSSGLSSTHANKQLPLPQID